MAQSGAPAESSWSPGLRRSLSLHSEKSLRPSTSLRCLIEKREKVQEQCLFYPASQIYSWAALFQISGTVWRRRSLWKVACYTLSLSFITGICFLLLVSDPSALAADRFLKLSTFLNVFVGMLLGLFLASAMARWYSCADGFATVCCAAENLQRELFTLGLDEDKVNSILRYSLLTGALLDLELYVEGLPSECRADAAEEMWDILESTNDKNFGKLVQPDEVAALQEANDSATVVTTWMGYLIGSMAKAGHIPAKQTPTYNRLMALVAQAHNGIGSVRAAVFLQPPYLYVQLLASLIHVNNILNALSFGMTCGTCVGTFLMYMGVCLHRHVPGAAERCAQVTLKDVSYDLQDTLISFAYSCAGPLIYQALLEVAMAIATPFSNVEASIDTFWRLEKLKVDLADCTKHGKMMVQERSSSVAEP